MFSYLYTVLQEVFLYACYLNDSRFQPPLPVQTPSQATNKNIFGFLIAVHFKIGGVTQVVMRSDGEWRGQTGRKVRSAANVAHWYMEVVNLSPARSDTQLSKRVAQNHMTLSVRYQSVP